MPHPETAPSDAVNTRQEYVALAVALILICLTVSALAGVVQVNIALFGAFLTLIGYEAYAFRTTLETL